MRINRLKLRAAVKTQITSETGGRYVRRFKSRNGMLGWYGCKISADMPTWDFVMWDSVCGIIANFGFTPFAESLPKTKSENGNRQIELFD